MKYQQEYELVLNHITTFESYPQFSGTFEDFKQVAFLMLNHKGKFLFASDILNMYSKGKTLEEIFSWNTDRFVQGAQRQALQRGGKSSLNR